MKKIAYSTMFALAAIFSSSTYMTAKNENSSQIWQETAKLLNDCNSWAKKNPKTVNALGLGAVAGGAVGTLKLLGKRTMAVRTGRGVFLGAVVCEVARAVCEPVYANLKKNKPKQYKESVDEVGYEVGLAAAAAAALAFA